MKEATIALWASIVRTVVPIVVGAVLGWLAIAGIELDSEFETALTAFVTALFAAVWYIAARIFETYVSPKLGVLLGLPKSPDSYSEHKPE